MSFTFLPRYNEAFPPESRNSSIDPEQGFSGGLRTPRKYFWSAIDKYFSFFRPASPPTGSRSYLKQLYEAFTRKSLAEACPTVGRPAVAPSSAINSRANLNPTPQKLNLNNFLMILLCACSPVCPPTKIMLCIPTPPDLCSAISSAGGCAPACAPACPPPCVPACPPPCPPPCAPACIPSCPGGVLSISLANAGTSAPKKCDVHPFCVPQKLPVCNSMATSKGKYLPPPEKRICPPGCLHVSDLREEKPCLALQGLPCLAHCFQSYPLC